METATGGAWLRAVLGQWGGWTRRHLVLTLLLSVGAFVFGWLWNTYIMAVNLQGSVVEPGQQTIATAPGQSGNGLFWLIFFSLLAGLITYGWQRGWRSLFADLGAIPRTFTAAVSESAGGALALLLWGTSVSLIISTLISSAVSLALGLVLLALAATPLGVILNFALIRLWKGLCAIVAPQARQSSVLSVAPFMTMVGEALGLLADWLLNSWIIGLVLGVACAVGSVLLSRNAWRPSTGAALLTIGLSVAFAVLRARGAWADDGGWQECVTSSGEPCSDAGIGGLFAWFGSEGSGTVMAHATVGGVSAGVGAAVGAGLGGAAAGLAGVGAASAAGMGSASPSGSSTTEASHSHSRLRPDTEQGSGHAQTTDPSGHAGMPTSGHADMPTSGHAATPTSGHAATSTSGASASSIPQQTDPSTAMPSTAHGHSGTPDGQDTTGRLSGLTPDVSAPEQVIPTQAAAASIEDFLPEPPDREEETGSERSSGA